VIAPGPRAAVDPRTASPEHRPNTPLDTIAKRLDISPPLADPTRRAVLERLGRGSATLTELAEPFGISLTGMKKHVRVLEAAELVTTEKVGRTRRCSLGPGRLDDAQEWMRMYRRMLDERLDRFGELLNARKERRQ
jgi:DNA-binding transcriptional ArsR family regulator